MNMAENDPNQVIGTEGYEEGSMTSDMEEDPIIVNRQASDSEDLYGVIVSSEQEAYELYCEFSGVQCSHKAEGKTNNVVRQVNYCCWKQGFSQDSDPSEVKKTYRLETRTGCLARIRFGLQDNNTFFESEHNHKLAGPEERQYLPTNRKVSEAHKGVIRSMKNAGMSTVETYSYLAEEVGGSQNVGFTKTDCYNFVSREKWLCLKQGMLKAWSI